MYGPTAVAVEPQVFSHESVICLGLGVIATRMDYREGGTVRPIPHLDAIAWKALMGPYKAP